MFLKVKKKNLPTTAKEKLKCFLRENFDIFAWKHEDMVENDHPRINLNATPHRQKRRALNP